MFVTLVCNDHRSLYLYHHIFVHHVPFLCMLNVNCFIIELQYNILPLDITIIIVHNNYILILRCELTLVYPFNVLMSNLVNWLTRLFFFVQESGYVRCVHSASFFQSCICTYFHLIISPANITLAIGGTLNSKMEKGYNILYFPKCWFSYN